MVEWKIPLYKIYTDDEDIQAVEKVIRRGTYWTTGPETDEFERIAAHSVGARYGVSYSSGTSALHALMLAHGIKDGDEVIVPSFTFIATANAPLFVGARPVFADIETRTFGLDPEDVARRITSRTKAIMPIHYGGAPCEIGPLARVASDHKILLIEDAAESIGASVDGRSVGHFGDSAMLSFCGNKVITTGEGGVVVTDSPELADRLRLFRSHGRLESEPYFQTVKSLDYIELGFNWRMSSITASLGISQMRKLPKVIGLRREKAKALSDRLSKLQDLVVPRVTDNPFAVFQMYSIRVKGGKKTRDRLKEHLKTLGIMSKVYFEPVHLTDFYVRNHEGSEIDLPVTEQISGEVLTLPIYPSMTSPELEYLVQGIEDFFAGKALN